MRRLRRGAAVQGMYVTLLTQIRYAQGEGEDEKDSDDEPNSNIVHVGRGGVGNVRSPSRDPMYRQATRAQQHELEDSQGAELKQYMHLSGRGGIGNVPPSHHDTEERGRGRRNASAERGVAGVLRSLSRSRSREPSTQRRDASRPPQRSLNQVAEDE